MSAKQVNIWGVIDVKELLSLANVKYFELQKILHRFFEKKKLIWGLNKEYRMDHTCEGTNMAYICKTFEPVNLTLHGCKYYL